MGLYYPAALGDFDGVADYLSRGSDLTGNADGKTGIISVWLRIDEDSASMSLLHNSTSRFWFRFTTTDHRFRVILKDSVGDGAMELRTATGLTEGSTWYNLLASWNTGTTTSHFYVNDSEDANEVSIADKTVDYTAIAWAIADNTSGGAKWNGAISELYFAPNQYLDFSIEANRRKFISGMGPVPLGENGELPTGVAPLIYMRTPYDDCGKNSGTGGDFVINGSPDDTIGPRPDLRERRRERYRQRAW